MFTQWGQQIVIGKSTIIYWDQGARAAAQQDAENANEKFASIFCAQAEEGVLTDVLRQAFPPGGVRPLIPSPAAVWAI